MTANTPNHGDERNRRWETQTHTDHYRNATTGEPITVTYPGVSGDVAEKWCAVCNDWITVGSGHDGGLVGFMVCPGCTTPWSADPTKGRNA